MISAKEAMENSLQNCQKDDNYEKKISEINFSIEIASKNGQFHVTIDTSKFSQGLKIQINKTLEKLNYKIEINIRIGKRAPNGYMAEVQKQCDGAPLKYGGITSREQLQENLRQHCIPQDFETMDASRYEFFLKERRKLMAAKVQEYYQGL
jgi:recombination DNA repair RAD52 pathway protein